MRLNLTHFFQFLEAKLLDFWLVRQVSFNEIILLAC